MKKWQKRPKTSNTRQSFKISSQKMAESRCWGSQCWTSKRTSNMKKSCAPQGTGSNQMIAPSEASRNIWVCQNWPNNRILSKKTWTNWNNAWSKSMEDMGTQSKRPDQWKNWKWLQMEVSRRQDHRKDSWEMEGCKRALPMVSARLRSFPIVWNDCTAAQKVMSWPISGWHPILQINSDCQMVVSKIWTTHKRFWSETIPPLHAVHSHVDQ